MTKNVLAVCQSCAEHNGGEFKNMRNTPPLFLGQCGCCKEVKACTHINYWKNIGTDFDMTAPKEAEEPKVAPKAAAKKNSVLG
jgi:hypothetical protein